MQAHETSEMQPELPSKTLPKSLEPQLEHLLVGRDRDL